MKGWQELRLITDGRWQPTGQLRDQHPFGSGGIIPTPQGVTVFDDIDTDNVTRRIWIPGPERDLRVGQLGWSPYTRIITNPALDVPTSERPAQ